MYKKLILNVASKNPLSKLKFGQPEWSDSILHQKVAMPSIGPAFMPQGRDFLPAEDELERRQELTGVQTNDAANVMTKVFAMKQAVIGDDGHSHARAKRQPFGEN